MIWSVEVGLTIMPSLPSKFRGSVRHRTTVDEQIRAAYTRARLPPSAASVVDSFNII